MALTEERKFEGYKLIQKEKNKAGIGLYSVLFGIFISILMPILYYFLYIYLLTGVL